MKRGVEVRRKEIFWSMKGEGLGSEVNMTARNGSGTLAGSPFRINEYSTCKTELTSRKIQSLASNQKQVKGISEENVEYTR